MTAMEARLNCRSDYDSERVEEGPGVDGMGWNGMEEEEEGEGMKE